MHDTGAPTTGITQYPQWKLEFKKRIKSNQIKSSKIGPFYFIWSNSMEFTKWHTFLNQQHKCISIWQQACLILFVFQGQNLTDIKLRNQLIAILKTWGLCHIYCIDQKLFYSIWCKKVCHFVNATELDQIKWKGQILLNLICFFIQSNFHWALPTTPPCLPHLKYVEMTPHQCYHLHHCDRWGMTTKGQGWPHEHSSWSICWSKASHQRYQAQ